MLDLLKKEIKNNNLSVETISDDIILVENFISDKEVKDIFDIINSTTEEDWKKEYLTNIKIFCMQKFGRDDIDNLVAEGKFQVTDNWEDKNLSIAGTEIQQKIESRLNKIFTSTYPDLFLNGFAMIQRMQEGVELKSHIDQTTDPSVMFATILYLNDNYSDGELFFKNLNISIKPKAGSLLIFPGTEKYEHGVHPVGHGPIRYVIVSFVKIKNFYGEGNKGY